MKQVIQNFRSGVLRVEDVPPPVLREAGVLVLNRVSLISAGTEKSTVQIGQKSLVGKAMERPEMIRKVLAAIQKDGLQDTLKRVFDRLDSPAALGYSCAGQIIAVGREASEFSNGDRVACAGQNYASHAEVVYIPKQLCVKLPDAIDFGDAAFVTLGAIALQGVRQAKPHLGERIAVIGLGLLLVNLPFRCSRSPAVAYSAPISTRPSSLWRSNWVGRGRHSFRPALGRRRIFGGARRRCGDHYREHQGQRPD